MYYQLSLVPTLFSSPWNKVFYLFATPGELWEGYSKSPSGQLSSRNINYSTERPYAWSKTGGAFRYSAIYFIKMSFCLPWNNNVARLLINDMWCRNLPPEVFHLSFHSDVLSADTANLLLTEGEQWCLIFYQWLWISLVEIDIPHKKPVNIVSVSWSSHCKARSTPGWWMAAAPHSSWCQQRIFLVLGSSLGVFSTSSPACLLTESAVVFGVRYNACAFSENFGLNPSWLGGF